VCLPVFFDPPGSIPQLIFGLMTSFLTFGIYMFWGPYIRDTDDRLAQLCQVQIFFVLLSSVALRYGPQHASASVSHDVLLCIVTVVPTTLYMVLTSPGRFLFSRLYQASHVLIMRGKRSQWKAQTDKEQDRASEAVQANIASMHEKIAEDSELWASSGAGLKQEEHKRRRSHRMADNELQDLKEPPPSHRGISAASRIESDQCRSPAAHMHVHRQPNQGQSKRDLLAAHKEMVQCKRNTGAAGTAQSHTVSTGNTPADRAMRREQSTALSPHRRVRGTQDEVQPALLPAPRASILARMLCRSRLSSVCQEESSLPTRPSRLQLARFSRDRGGCGMRSSRASRAPASLWNRLAAHKEVIRNRDAAKGALACTESSIAQPERSQQCPQLCEASVEPSSFMPLGWMRSRRVQSYTTGPPHERRRSSLGLYEASLEPSSYLPLAIGGTSAGGTGVTPSSVTNGSNTTVPMSMDMDDMEA